MPLGFHKNLHGLEDLVYSLAVVVCSFFLNNLFVGALKTANNKPELLYKIEGSQKVIIVLFSANDVEIWEVSDETELSHVLCKDVFAPTNTRLLSANTKNTLGRTFCQLSRQALLWTRTVVAALSNTK